MAKKNQQDADPLDIKPEDLASDETIEKQLSVTVIGMGKFPELWEGREVNDVPTADAEYLEEMGAVKIKK